VGDGLTRLIYHPTPHRGLEILVPVFEQVCDEYNLWLDVYSSFDLYARPEANKPYEPLFERCRDHSRIGYHGSQPHDVVRDAVARADVFTYPSIWRETSCMSAMEAMSAGCMVVAPTYGALAETLGCFAWSYDFTEDTVIHADRFKAALEDALAVRDGDDTVERVAMQKAYADRFYSWDRRIDEWVRYLEGVAVAPPVRRGTVTWL
jgi:UDP-glucose:(glucosyl)LPS alpha-1,2-glucosyltransferase